LALFEVSEGRCFHAEEEKKQTQGLRGKLSGKETCKRPWKIEKRERDRERNRERDRERKALKSLKKRLISVQQITLFHALISKVF